MSDTTFVNNSTVIDASWLNDVNDTVYTGLGGEQTVSGIRTHLGLGTAALTNTGTSAGNTVVLDGTAKLPAVDGSQLTNITSTTVDVTGATGTLPVLHGGTDATTAGGARTNLGSTTIGDAVFTAATVAAAQQAMDVEVGVDVQAYDANLQTLAGLSLAQGDILVATGADTVARLPKGTALQQLRMNSGETAPEWVTASGLTSGTAIATTSGTSHDFTGVPSGVKKITVTLQGVSTNGTSSVVLQLGDSGGVETSGYAGSVYDWAAWVDLSGYPGFSDNTSGVSVLREGTFELTLIDSSTNTWACTYMIGFSHSAGGRIGSGTKSLSGTLDRVRLTTGNGTDTFDAGKVNIVYQ
jgi:hypothetical protein